jgi:hypothetical protein
MMVVSVANVTLKLFVDDGNEKKRKVGTIKK